MPVRSPGWMFVLQILLLFCLLMTTSDLTEKQLRNLPVTLAVIIAKLKLNAINQADGKNNFVSREGLYHYIGSLVSHAMQGTDKLEIPDFYYDREGLSDYSLLKQLLSSSLTNLQRFSQNPRKVTLMMFAVPYRQA